MKGAILFLLFLLVAIQLFKPVSLLLGSDGNRAHFYNFFFPYFFRFIPEGFSALNIVMTNAGKRDATTATVLTAGLITITTIQPTAPQ